MESYGVTIQIKPLQQYFHTLQFIKYLVPLLSLCMKSYENETPPVSSILIWEYFS